MGWIHMHPYHELVVSALGVCTHNTIDQTLWFTIPKRGPAMGVVQSWTSTQPQERLTSAPEGSGLKAYMTTPWGKEVASKCAAIWRRKPREVQQYHERMVGCGRTTNHTQWVGSKRKCPW